MNHRTGAALAVLGLALALPACGSDDEESSGGGSSGGSTPAAFEVTVADAGKGQSTVKAPKTVKAGLVEVSVQNSGKRPHDAQIIGVDGDRTAEDVKKVIDAEGGPLPQWLHGGGGVGTVAPGQSASATDLLEPGRYFVIDTDGGGSAEFEVTGEASDAQLPSTDATITANEYGFETTGLKTGKNEVTFENAGKELHHALAVPYAKGATLAQVRKFATSDEEPSGPPPVDFENAVGTTVLDGGRSQVTELEFKKKGKYALVCFIQDRKGGPPHVVKGMIAEVEVQ
jgi:uncharacterized cupredoxin-like copper-binding protein